jgi:hypothetical protein
LSPIFETKLLARDWLLEHQFKMATKMPSKEFLLEQIARAKRFAKGMTSKDDREKFERVAADYQSQLDAAAETTVPTAAAATRAEAAAPSNEAPATPRAHDRLK